MEKNIITITENAASYIRSVLDDKTVAGQAPLGLRISIKKGGCSGSEYDFQYASAKHPFDEEVKQHGITVFIDPAAFLQILGSTMDYEEDLFASKLTFSNPNEEGRCGCGKSVQFTVPKKGDEHAN